MLGGVSFFDILDLWVFPRPYLSLHINITIGYGVLAPNQTLWKTKDEHSLNLLTNGSKFLL